MPFADLPLSKRLESAEGQACAGFAAARRRIFPSSAAEAIECGGGYAVFDGVDSPVTQTFALGLFEPLTAAHLDTVEQFFLERGAPVQHEVSPLAGVAALDLLCARGYRPIELASVMYQPVEDRPRRSSDNITVRQSNADEAQLWSELSARAWSHDHPEFREFIESNGVISAGREHSPSFLAELHGEPGATGSLFLHGGVALFAGAATAPEMRCRGLQAALLEARMRFAFDHGCDLAMIATEAGSQSQRNAERRGFRIAYTRTKWRLVSAAASPRSSEPGA